MNSNISDDVRASINAEYAEAYFDECQILKAEIARLRAALEAQLEAHNYAEVLEIARKALANKEEGK